MIDSSRMNKLKSSEQLVKEELNVVVGKGLAWFDYDSKICFH